MTDDERTELETLRHTERALANFTAQQPNAAAVSLECCAECGGEIPEARRQALPGVTLCVDCKRVEERRERIT